MSWLQLDVSTTAQYVDEISDVLTAVGALATTCLDAKDQAIFDLNQDGTPIWDEVIITAIFSDDAETQLITNMLKSLLAETKYQLGNFEALADKDWQQAWKENFNPIQFADNLWVCPSWHETPDPTAINIILDPGMAFGTGTHETTALCLTWLTKAELQHKTVIDYGCGSGILAIAAKKLGANIVHAIDNDPQAVKVCLENANSNHIDDDNFKAYHCDEQHNITANILVANILANPLIELAPTITPLLKSHATLVMSGILSHQIKDVMTAYENAFTFEQPTIDNDWCLLVATKR